MTLLTPRTYRLTNEQDNWLRDCAQRQGHGNKSITLRMLIHLAMTKSTTRLIAPIRKGK